MMRLLILTGLFVIETMAFASDAPCPEGLTSLTLSPANWTTAYTGFGHISFTNKNLEMAPNRTRSPQNTHASLVLSKIHLPAENFKLLVEYQNVQALREGTPNPWELMWVFFQYQPGLADQKTTNYVVAKTNGLELGKASGTVDQVFLKTTEAPAARFNHWHSLMVQRQGTQLSVQLDNNPPIIWDESSAKEENRLYRQQGMIGLYAEDARVQVRKVCLSKLAD